MSIFKFKYLVTFNLNKLFLRSIDKLKQALFLTDGGSALRNQFMKLNFKILNVNAAFFHQNLKQKQYLE
jgi:hypothetical protein